MSPREPEPQAGQRRSPRTSPWGGSTEEEGQLPGVLEEPPETCWGRDLLGAPEGTVDCWLPGESWTLGKAMPPTVTLDTGLLCPSCEKRTGVSDLHSSLLGLLRLQGTESHWTLPTELVLEVGRSISDFPVPLAGGGGRRASMASNTTDHGVNGFPGHRIWEAVPRLHTQQSLVNRVPPPVLAGGQWTRAFSYCPRP